MYVLSPCPVFLGCSRIYPTDRPTTFAAAAIIIFLHHHCCIDPTDKEGCIDSCDLRLQFLSCHPAGSSPTHLAEGNSLANAGYRILSSRAELPSYDNHANKQTRCENDSTPCCARKFPHALISLRLELQVPPPFSGELSGPHQIPARSRRQAGQAFLG